jgi:hypothetical protein
LYLFLTERLLRKYLIRISVRAGTIEASLEIEEEEYKFKRREFMKKAYLPLAYEQPLDMEILEAYINKNANYKRADARKIRRAIRKISTY